MRLYDTVLIDIQEIFQILRRLFRLSYPLKTLKKFLHQNLAFPQLIVSFMFHPAAWIQAQNTFTRFVENENQNGKWQRREPPPETQSVHAQSVIQAGAVGQKGS